MEAVSPYMQLASRSLRVLNLASSVSHMLGNWLVDFNIEKKKDGSSWDSSLCWAIWHCQNETFFITLNMCHLCCLFSGRTAYMFWALLQRDKMTKRCSGGEQSNGGHSLSAIRRP
jgi:hypothetical protein